MTKFLVTIAPPTPNGDLHLGHVSGPYLCSDIFTRVQRLKGHSVYYVSYSDDYQSYVDRKAREQGVSPSELALHYSKEIATSLSRVAIEVDNFMFALDNPVFLESVRKTYSILKENSALLYETVDVPYFPSVEKFGYEAFGRGQCHDCGDESDASQCESCYCAPDWSKMIGFKSVLDNKPYSLVQKECVFLDLERFRPDLIDICTQLCPRAEAMNWLVKQLAYPIAKWPISRSGGYGIPVEGHGQTLSTWFSGLSGYYAALQEVFEDRDCSEVWSNDTTLVNFIGLDCIFSHAIAYPVMRRLLPNSPSGHLIYTNKFLKLNGEDFSTSRNYAIWVKEFADEYDADAIRLYLASIAPEEDTENFSLEQFRDFYQNLFMPFVSLVRATSGKVELNRFRSFICGETIVLREVLNWHRATSAGTFSAKRMATSCVNVMKIALAHSSASDLPYYVILAMVLANPLAPRMSAEYFDAGRAQGIAARDVCSEIFELGHDLGAV